MTENTRVFDRFKYHLEDLNCVDCLHCKRKSKHHKNGCHKYACRFEDIRNDAISNNRIKRRRGHFSLRHYQKPKGEVLVS